MTKRFNILFLCTGDSCRSQMAEGWAQELSGPLVGVQSAGIEAHGKSHRAIAVMKGIGLDISGQDSTIVTDEMSEQADPGVTVCGHADEHCPLLPPGTQKVHWPLEDPAKATGTEEEIMDVFRGTRDDIKQCVTALLQESTQPE